jgi:long-chain acyl-CoA synthetase
VRRVAPAAAPTAWERLMRRARPRTEDFPACLAALPETPPVAWPPLAAPHPDAQPAVLLRTSGSTGRPRLVVLHRGALRAQVLVMAEALEIGPGSRLLDLLPLDHLDGLVMGALLAVERGASLLRPDEAGVPGLVGVLDQVYRERASHLVAVPAVLGLLLRDGADLAEVLGHSGFRMVVSTAAPLPEALWKRVEALSGRPVVNVYGLTETGNLAFTAASLGVEGRHGTVGHLRGCEHRVVDPSGATAAEGASGELLLRGPAGARALWGGGALLDEEGWYHTGDRVERAADGALRVLGRVRQQVSIGGLKVDPLEVEGVVRAHPGVEDAWVGGEPDPIWGDRLVCTYVGAGVPAEALVGWLRERLSEHKVPRSIEAVAQIERGASGKVRARAQAGGRVSDQVIALAAGVFRVPREALALDQGPEELPGWDSVGHLDFVLAVEERFGVRLAPRDLAGLRTLGDVVRLVEALRAG